jgi:hypothetical protein
MQKLLQKPLFEPLPFKDLGEEDEYRKKVLFFDPSSIYDRIIIDPFKRFQSVSIIDMFPKIPGHCSCGCGKGLRGRQTRWATDECNKFAVAVWAIIAGRTSWIGMYLSLYHKNYHCCKCSSSGTIKIDHIIPVKLGGGGCWLNNYQLLCHDCHVKKTNEDFGWKQKKSVPSLFAENC